MTLHQSAGRKKKLHQLATVLLFLISFRTANICCLLTEKNKAHCRCPVGLSWLEGPCLAWVLRSGQMEKGQLNTYMATEAALMNAAKAGLVADWLHWLRD